MENDRLIELLQEVRADLINGDARFQYGICNVLTVTYAKLDDFRHYEYMFIKHYLKTNKPNIRNQYKEFTKNEFWINDEYWWYPIWQSEKTKQIRIDYLSALIDNVLK